METKKGAYQNAPITPPNNETPQSEAVLKYQHQHNTVPQHLRLLQYGLKIPNHQHNQLNQSQTYTHQQINPPLYLHIHQHNTHTPQQYSIHRTPIQQSPQQINNVNLLQNLQYNQQKSNNQPPPPIRPHNIQINQNASQIWVPYQQPVHCHQQSNQTPTEVQKQIATPQQPINNHQKLKDIPNDKKKSNSSSNAQLRSPSAKRPPEAPVTMQGWLHKQGSEGLMLWKKRWFVLSEYCLFYYKGPEEEKLLGSILLPSYKVSICGPEDKVNRKFAFKCEHANMRTYILAADSQELMLQWIRVLNLACLVQNNVEVEQQQQQQQQSQSVTPSTINNAPIYNSQPTSNTEHLNNYRQQYMTQNQKNRSTPVHMHTSSNTTDLSNPSQQESSQYNQPLYANAPPKPRRLNDGYSSPSPDVFENYIPQAQSNSRQVPKSPVNLYGHVHMNSTQSDYNLQQQHRPKHNAHDYIFVPTNRGDVYHQNNMERRTPDTYGRSKLNSSNKPRQTTDYEDVYVDQTMYKRPLSPIAYTHSNMKANPVVNPLYRAYTPVNMTGPKDININQYSFHDGEMKKSPSTITRPHSADFLEYELHRRQPNSTLNTLNNHQPRPKSSLDINRNANDSDNYFYSEERYAEKMRKSVQYLPNMPRYMLHPNNQGMQHQNKQQRQRVLKCVNEPEQTSQQMCSNTQPLNFDNLQMNQMQIIPQPARSRSVLSEGSLSKELDMELESSNRDYPYSKKQPHAYMYNDDRTHEYDQFTRSASARLAQTDSHTHGDHHKSLNKDGDRKREESMKRLLEWKQRMLQSPLNRKAQSHRGYSMRREAYYNKQAHDYERQSHLYNDEEGSSNNLPQYNSYSSDDEENEEGSKETVHAQAGRTLDIFPNNSESETLTPAHTNSIIVFNTLKESEKPLLTISDAKHEHTPNALATQEKIKKSDTCFDDSTFTEPLIQFNKESSNLAHVSSLKSEYSGKFEQSPVVTEIKSNGALVKTILAEFEKNDSNASENSTKHSPKSTPTKNIENLEENYMTMTPRKNILEPKNSNNSDTTVIFNEQELDENPYVEMTQNIESAFLMQSKNENELQPYELVCFSEGNFEPVYMELRNPETKTTFNESSKQLPDILTSPQHKKESITGNKSESSDADDEASKDLDSLDTPSHPRFSLSDNFRPASYYLGANRNVPEFQDSSDSELVSPPPIPTSPPPLDDLENNDEPVSVTNEDKKDSPYQFSSSINEQFFSSSSKNNKANRYSLNSSVNKHNPNYLSSSTLGKDQDNTSICSINTDNDCRFSSRLSQNSDSDVELRLSLSRRNADYARMLKRRPVSEEFCDELDSIDSERESNFNGTVDSVDLDKYLRDLQNSNVSGSDILETNSSTKLYHEYENLYITGYMQKLDKSTLDNILEQTPTKTNPETSERQSILSSDDFTHRARPESSTSISAEISGILQNSNRSTPSVRLGSSMSLQETPATVSQYFQDKSTTSPFNQPAPYYYSDLSMNSSTIGNSMLTLNNQRETTMNGNKRDISLIINPIKCNGHFRNSTHSHSRRNAFDDNNTFKLAAEARSASVDFLNFSDKSGHIDKKNIYESDTLKRIKQADLVSNVQLDSESRNLYLIRNNEKFNLPEINDIRRRRRSHSLEGLLENVLSETFDTISNDVNTNSNNTMEIVDNCNMNNEGSYLWEEDSIWRERLRLASERHTKSMDDLNKICGDGKKIQKKSPRGITRCVTYVNDNIYNMPLQNKKFEETDDKNETENKNDCKKETSFIIDREKLRQWDLLSSAPADDKLSITASQEHRGNNTTIEIGDESICEPTDCTNNQQSASGSISLNVRDTFPKALSSKRVWSGNMQPTQSRSVSNLAKPFENEYFKPHPQNYYINQGSSQHNISNEHVYMSRKDNLPLNDKMNVSAGELLGRTHEELVLLLIQLRRQSAITLQAIENCYNESDTLQAQLHTMDQAKRLEQLQKLEQIKQHLIELEKQYEKGKPLVNLVDNMVKLGSLYRSPNDRNINPYIQDRLEFNQQIQERRLLAEEKRDWNRLTPNHLQLQEKVQQLYQLDRLIQEESGTLQNLQQDKEDIERALGGLRLRINQGFKDPAEVEQARKQQANLENELSRVHLMLAQNSKKLEETVAGNARLEQELLVLKQKLQVQRQQRNSAQFSNAGDSLTCAMGTSAMLESDLQRVQQKVGDLQKQRQELSMQVRQLTDRSNYLQQQFKPSSSSSSSSSSSQNLINKKKMTSLWRETDLDTMSFVDHGDSWDMPVDNTSVPLYINIDTKQSIEGMDFYNRMKSSDSTSDDIMQNSIIPHEKQEIKTVRIVKRESERRQRDREKGSVSGKWDALVEEDTSLPNTNNIFFSPTPVQKTQSSIDVASPVLETPKTNETLIKQNSVSSPNLPQIFNDRTSGKNLEKSPELSPIFKSEAARQIITEMSITTSSAPTPQQTNRRIIPKEKRRHYTAPHNNLIMKSLNQLPTHDNICDKVLLNDRRARDDLDMERALRQRIDTPDVVRSTLNHKELKYNENTIDNILGTPNKITIPERYIPEKLPQLSAEEQEHRLRKVESIKKMLSDAAIISTSSTNIASDDKEANKTLNNVANKATSKMIEEKKQREHLLQLNQILAKQVMEMSKIVAVKALATLPLQPQQMTTDEEDSSPSTPLPLYQQRDNFYS